MDLKARIEKHFRDSARLKLDVLGDLSAPIALAADRMVQCLLGEGKILACGNGGSAADAQHHCSKTFLNLSLQQTRAQRHLEKKIAEFKAMRDERELVQKLDADRAMDSILGEKAIPLPTVGVVFSREYLIARVAFRHHNKGADLRTFDRYWGDPKAKTPA